MPLLVIYVARLLFSLFDTLDSTEQLEKIGFTQEQAVVQTKVIRQALSQGSKNYTIRQDLELLEEQLKRQIDGLRSDFHLALLEKNYLETKIRQGKRHVIIVIGVATAIPACLMTYLNYRVTIILYLNGSHTFEICQPVDLCLQVY